MPKLTYYRVDEIESERGWGSKVDDVSWFRTKEEAEAYIKKFNSRNTAATAPDWYMRADGPYIETIDESLFKLILEDAKKLHRQKKKQTK